MIKYLFNVSIVIILCPAFLWLVSCAAMSFISWHNYFIVNFEDWDLGARALFLIALVIVLFIALVNLPTNSIKRQL
jgi:hypothetical protein